jgi:predicted nucleotidyltransferase
VDVSLPIRSVIPSLDGPVLAALSATSEPASLTAVHRLTGGVGSLNGVRNVLLRLVDAGIVDDVPGGYVLNREHLAAPAIEQLAGLHGELVGRLRSELDAWDGEVRVAGLFGSVARRDGDADSDVDLLVVSDSSGLDDLADHLANRVRRWTGNDAQVVTKSTAEMRRLQRRREPIIGEWDRDFVVLAGERSLLTRAAA